MSVDLWKRIIRKIIVTRFRLLNKNKDFTIISQNCIGGVIYSDLDIPFKTPTINMFIEDENFVKLCENFEHYINIDPVPITDNYSDPIDESIVYPKIKIDDIEVCCLHYESCAIAIDAWNRRRKRVNLDNVYVIANSWNLHDKVDLIERLIKTKYKTVIFSEKKYNYSECIQLPGDFWQLDNRYIIRPNITDYIPGSNYRYFEKFFDFVKWLN